LEAARIITRLPIFTNTEYLYRETGWERLEERRTKRNLQLFYDIQNGSTHPYLLDLQFARIRDTTVLHLYTVKVLFFTDCNFCGFWITDVFAGIVLINFSLCNKIVLVLFFTENNKTNVTTKNKKTQLSYRLTMSCSHNYSNE
jgi:hypothetical protein